MQRLSKWHQAVISDIKNKNMDVAERAHYLLEAAKSLFFTSGS